MSAFSIVWCDMFKILKPWQSCVTPQRVAFLGSLLLSLVAYLGAVTIGKDGAFYVDVAQTIADQGVAAGAERFHWIGFPLLLAALHKLTALPIEGLAYLICGLFLAGTCTLLVDLAVRGFPRSAWWAVLVVLAMPAFNEFRSDIIREHGFWFFTILSLWLAQAWYDRGKWWRAIAIQVSIFAAATFRLEALLLEGVFALWLLSGLRLRIGRIRFLQLYWLPLVFACVLVSALPVLSWQRVQYFASMLDPAQVYDDFKVLAAQFADSLKYKYSRDDAGFVVFFGVCGLIMVKFFKLLGPFVFPLLTSAGRAGGWQAASYYKTFLLAWSFYFFVLLLFFFNEQFVNSRYVSFLNILFAPIIALVVAKFAECYCKLGRILLVIGLLVMLGGVISLSPKKTHYIEAGRWMAAHYDKTDTVFYGDARVGYYAGWGYSDRHMGSVLELSVEALRKYKLFVVEAAQDESWLQEWLEKNNLKRVALFSNGKGDEIQIIAHKGD